MAGRIVVFGATGYTGELTVRALVSRGARPVLAARSPGRLAPLAADLGGLETAVADVSRPESVRALVQRGDVLISTVGPFTRWGAPAVEAAIDAGATYLDSTGEPAFIRRVFEQNGPRAAAARCALIPAFGYDWVPGNLAGALALRDAGPDATRVEIGYFAQGERGVSGGTQASLLGAALEPSFTYRRGQLVTERSAARVKTFELADGKPRRAVSVGTSEHFGLPALYPQLRDIDVMIGMAGGHVPYLPMITRAISTATAIPPARNALQSLLARRVKGSTGGPGPELREHSSSTIVAAVYSSAGQRLAHVTLNGPNGYTFTGEILAWGAITAAHGGVQDVGALGPATAFGLDGLAAGAQQAGFITPSGTILTTSDRNASQ